MTEHKLFAFDIDGTLLDSNKRPLPSTVNALNELKKAGHYVMIATGRSRYLASKVIKELSFDHYVLCNGSAAFINHQQVYKQLLPKEQLQEFLKEAHSMEIDTSFISLDVSKRSTTFNPAYMQEAMHSFGSEMPELATDFIDKNDVYQVLAFYDASYENFFDANYSALDFVRWHPKCVDVIPKGGSKAITILKVAEELGLSVKDVIAFGDGMNDREMLRASGTGIAMGNASLEVQGYADIVTEDNDNDGIWKALVSLGYVK